MSKEYLAYIGKKEKLCFLKIPAVKLGLVACCTNRRVFQIRVENITALNEPQSFCLDLRHF